MRKAKLIKVFRPATPPPACKGGCGKPGAQSQLCPRIAEWLRQGEMWVSEQ